MENVDAKKWKQKKEETKAILKNTPKNEHMVYFVDFKKGTLENKVAVDDTNVLDFNKMTKPKVKNPRKKPSAPKNNS